MFSLRTDFVAENGSRSDGPRELLSRAPAANWMPLAALHDRYYHRLFVDYFHLFRQLTIFFFAMDADDSGGQLKLLLHQIRQAGSSDEEFNPKIVKKRARNS